MEAEDIAERYVEAWNEHDPGSIVDCFAPGGTYEDPATGGALTGRAIASYAQALFDAFVTLTAVFVIETIVAPVAVLLLLWAGGRRLLAA